MPRSLVRWSAAAILLSAAASLAGSPLVAQTRRAVAPAATPLVVSAEWLGAHLADPDLVLVEVIDPESANRAQTIAGARRVSYAEFVVSRNGLRTELPEPDSLRAVFERLGISTTSHVVVFADEAPMATRMLLSLDYLGHRRFSYLDGGLMKWAAEMRPQTTTAPRVRRGSLRIAPKQGLVADADWLLTRLGKPGIALIDTRTTGEYNGSGNRSGMPSAGHLAGARQLEWESLFTEGNGLLLRPQDELKALYAARVQPGDTVVTYCWVGYRASATYFVARLLGYPTRFYDGSYQDWQARKLPTRAGETP